MAKVIIDLSVKLLMTVIYQRRVSQLQKDVSLATEENIFLFTTTAKLFGAEICVAEIRQA